MVLDGWQGGGVAPRDWQLTGRWEKNMALGKTVEMPPVVHSQRGSRSGREREWYAETSLNHCRAIKRSLRRFVSSRTKSTPIAVGDKTLSGSCWRSLSTGQNILRGLQNQWMVLLS